MVDTSPRLMSSSILVRMSWPPLLLDLLLLLLLLCYCLAAAVLLLLSHTGTSSPCSQKNMLCFAMPVDRIFW